MVFHHIEQRKAANPQNQESQTRSSEAAFSWKNDLNNYLIIKKKKVADKFYRVFQFYTVQLNGTRFVGNLDFDV